MDEDENMSLSTGPEIARQAAVDIQRSHAATAQSARDIAATRLSNAQRRGPSAVLVRPDGSTMRTGLTIKPIPRNEF